MFFRCIIEFKGRGSTSRRLTSRDNAEGKKELLYRENEVIFQRKFLI